MQTESNPALKPKGKKSFSSMDLKELGCGEQSAQPETRKICKSMPQLTEMMLSTETVLPQENADKPAIQDNKIAPSDEKNDESEKKDEKSVFINNEEGLVELAKAIVEFSIEKAFSDYQTSVGVSLMGVNMADGKNLRIIGEEPVDGMVETVEDIKPADEPPATSEDANDQQLMGEAENREPDTGLTGFVRLINLIYEVEAEEKERVEKERNAAELKKTKEMIRAMAAEQQVRDQLVKEASLIEKQEVCGERIEQEIVGAAEIATDKVMNSGLSEERNSTGKTVKMDKAVAEMIAAESSALVDISPLDYGVESPPDVNEALNKPIDEDIKQLCMILVDGCVEKAIDKSLICLKNVSAATVGESSIQIDENAKLMKDVLFKNKRKEIDIEKLRRAVDASCGIFWQRVQGLPQKVTTTIDQPADIEKLRRAIDKCCGMWDYEKNVRFIKPGVEIPITAVGRKAGGKALPLLKTSPVCEIWRPLVDKCQADAIATTTNNAVKLPVVRVAIGQTLNNSVMQNASRRSSAIDHKSIGISAKLNACDMYKDSAYAVDVEMPTFAETNDPEASSSGVKQNQIKKWEDIDKESIHSSHSGNRCWPKRKSGHNDGDKNKAKISKGPSLTKFFRKMSTKDSADNLDAVRTGRLTRFGQRVRNTATTIAAAASDVGRATGRNLATLRTRIFNRLHHNN